MNVSAGADSALPMAIDVRLEGASLRYANVDVFRDLTLDLPAGSTTCLLGPSGVGKSSLLRLIAGLAPTARLRSLSCGDGRAPMGRIAYMEQRDSLLPWLSVLENVTLGARLRGERADLERAHALLAEVGLSDAAGLPPASLSGGMRQRAALARTLLEDRPIVLMDEPFSAVDALTRLNLQNLAARLLHGRTVLMVTHDPLEALRLGTRILVLTGQPAVLHEATVPDGPTPRDATDPALLGLIGPLLQRLGEGQPAC